MEHIAEFFEIAMLVAFGLSWPVNGIKAWRARTARGTSPFFLLLIIGGYLCGIASKLISGHFAWYVLMCYILNTLVVTVNLLIYFRNRRLDRQNGGAKS